MAYWNSINLWDKEEFEDTEEEEPFYLFLPLPLKNDNFGEDIHADEADLDESHRDWEDETVYCPECGVEIDGTRCDICGKIVLL